MSSPAAVVSTLWEKRQEQVSEQLDPVLSMEVFGFDMDNAAMQANLHSQVSGHFESRHKK